MLQAPCGTAWTRAARWFRSMELLTRSVWTSVSRGADPDTGHWSDVEWVIVMQPCAGNKVIYKLDNIIWQYLTHHLCFIRVALLLLMSSRGPSPLLEVVFPPCLHHIGYCWGAQRDHSVNILTLTRGQPFTFTMNTSLMCVYHCTANIQKSDLSC